MKTVQVSVERNFHCMNEDRFIMEKISMTAELDESDYWESVANELRERITQNFKAAYPNVRSYLNFDEVIQVKQNGISLPTDAEFYSRNDNLNLPTTIPDKINKGTIEEQIEACTEIELPNGLLSFEYLASMNKKLKVVYDKKLAELKKQGV